MCELAFLSPQDKDTVDLIDMVMQMWESNSDGLGIVAIRQNEEENKFEYNAYKAVTPLWSNVLGFIQEHQDAWRFAIHARLATAGGVGVEQAHPIFLDCPETDIDFVMHNGVVTGAETARDYKQDELGHEFSTEVDTEVIPHAHGSLPDTLDDLEDPNLTGSLNYFLFTEDRILMRAGWSYHFDDSPRVAKRKRDIVTGNGRKRKWILIQPNGETEMDTATRSTYYSGNSVRVRRNGNSVTYTGQRKSTSQIEEDEEGEEDEEAEEEELGDEEIRLEWNEEGKAQWPQFDGYWPEEEEITEDGEILPSTRGGDVQDGPFHDEPVEGSACARDGGVPVDDDEELSEEEERRKWEKWWDQYDERKADYGQ